MENIIRDNQIDPITANLVRHIKGCRPSINRAMGWNMWRKSLRYYTMPLNLTYPWGVSGFVGHHMNDTYAELIDVLPEPQTYPWDATFNLSPFGDGGSHIVDITIFTIVNVVLRRHMGMLKQSV